LGEVEGVLEIVEGEVGLMVLLGDFSENNLD
jgi:hypothetical protein